MHGDTHKPCFIFCLAAYFLFLFCFILLRVFCWNSVVAIKHRNGMENSTTHTKENRCMRVSGVKLWNIFSLKIHIIESLVKYFRLMKKNLKLNPSFHPQETRFDLGPIRTKFDYGLFRAGFNYTPCQKPPQNAPSVHWHRKKRSRIWCWWCGLVSEKLDCNSSAPTDRQSRRL